MLKNYIKIAWRNLIRNLGYSFINIGGLAAGITVAILIGLWVWDETSYNKGFKHYDDIGMARSHITIPNTGESNSDEHLFIPMAASLKESYHHYFKHILLAWYQGDYTVTYAEDNSKHKGYFIEGGAIDMLSIQMVKGNNKSLDETNSIIISEKMAEAVFGDKDPINEIIKLNNDMVVQVTGVYAALPTNSEYGELDFICPWSLFVASNDWVKPHQTTYNSNSFYILVQKEANIEWTDVNKGIASFYKDTFPSDAQEDVSKYNASLYINPMSKWYLFSEFKNGYPDSGRITFVWLFSIIGVFVLALACINFINLSTARSESRAKEVGIRKAIGSKQSQLFYQFMSESFLVVILAFVLSIGLISLSLSSFNQLADKSISLPFNNSYFWLISVVFIISTAFLSGIYPAIFLSSFQPVKVLKGNLTQGRFSSLPRKALVVVQFTVSLVLIIGTVVVYQQIQHTRNRPVGYQQEGLITMGLYDPNFNGKKELIKSQLLNTGELEEVAYSSAPLTAVWNNEGGFYWTDKDPEDVSNFAITEVSYDFGKLAEWELIAGRDYSKSYSDSANIIINESAAKHLGFENPIGEFIQRNNGEQSWQIIGVVKDIVAVSPYEPVKMSMYRLDNNYSDRVNQLHFRIKADHSASEAIPKIQKVMTSIVPSAPFEYAFVDDTYGQKFSSELRIGKLATLFAILAILISCLGLFGLSSFMAGQRIKEIGVRKVLGASVMNLWQLLSKDFLILVFISIFIASPIAWYVMESWLENYNYQTEISLWIFTVAGIGVLAVTILTVSYQSIKAAMMNPVESLKSE